jgi:hypothetical protein
MWASQPKDDNMTKEEFQEELEKFCIYHGYEIAGTCGSEGIYGEITVRRIGEDPKWREWEKNVFNWNKE